MSLRGVHHEVENPDPTRCSALKSGSEGMVTVSLGASEMPVLITCVGGGREDILDLNWLRPWRGACAVRGNGLGTSQRGEVGGGKRSYSMLPASS